MHKDCLNCGENFESNQADLDFYKKVSPKIGGHVFEIPDPKLCPSCRSQRRLSFRNERKLYKRKCDLCEKDLISMYSPDAQFPVYCPECWYSDKWDQLEYGQDFDFSKSFMENFALLQKRVPRFSIFNKGCENSDYVNFAPYNKDCYLLFGSWYNERSFYSHTLDGCSDCLDDFALKKSELCYECVDSEKIYNSIFCQGSKECRDSAFLYNCNGCIESAFCYNLRNKKHYLFNKPSTKDEIENFLKSLSSYERLQEAIEKFKQILQKEAVHKYYRGSNNENSSGDILFNCKNVKDAFVAYDGEDLRYCYRSFGQKDSLDFEGGGKGELTYDSMSNDFGFMTAFSSLCENLKDSYYNELCFVGENLFGCISLRNKKYCVLNKQYTKEEYEKLVGKIIEHMRKTGEWGEFFPTEISPFAYNETVAQEYYPLTKEEVLNTKSKWWNILSPPDKGDLGGSDFDQQQQTPLATLVRGGQKGWKWRDEEDKLPDVTKIIPAERLPDEIGDIPDDILNWAIKCEKTGRPFKIQKIELDFYRKMNLPVPHFHPDVRHEMRMKQRNPRKLWKRNCGQCGEGIETTYAPERPERVLCEECYLKNLD